MQSVKVAGILWELTPDNVAVGAQGAEFICSKIESGEVAIIEGDCREM